MIKKIVLLAIGYFSGLITIQLLPSFEKEEPSYIFADMLFNLEKSFVGMLFFFFSFMCFSILVRSGIREAYLLLKKEKTSFKAFILSLQVYTLSYFLFQKDLWITLVLLIFATVYGMISVDLDRTSRDEIGQ